jgi:hypothetical protein
MNQMKQMKTLFSNRLPRTSRMCLLLCMLLAALIFVPQQAKAAIGGSGSVNDPFTIGSADDFNSFKNRIVNWADQDNKYWKLTANINLGADFFSIGKYIGSGTESVWKSFSGVFDGDGHTITFNYIYDKTPKRGFFAETNNATIKNLTINYKGIDNYNTPAYDGACSGGLIGYATGNLTIDNVHIRQTGNSYIRGPLYGGLVGQIWNGNNISISNSSVEMASNCNINLYYWAGYHFYAGGLVGEIKGCKSTKITDCYAYVNFSFNETSPPK